MAMYFRKYNINHIFRGCLKMGCSYYQTLAKNIVSLDGAYLSVCLSVSLGEGKGEGWG